MIVKNHNHEQHVWLVDVDATEEGLNDTACGGVDSPMHGWRRYRIEYGGPNVMELTEGVIYLPPRANAEAVVDLIMGMQAREKIWKVLK